MRILRQTVHLLTLLLATHRARPRDGVLVCLGFVIATAIMTITLAIPTGIERIIGKTGQRDIAVVVGGESPYETTSQLSPDQVAIVSQLPQVARNETGRPLVAPQFLANAKLTRPDGERSTVMLHGVTAVTWELLDSTQIRTQPPLQEGSRQILVSAPLAQQFAALRQPDLRLQGREWQLAGTLDANGNLWESELWTDFSALQAAYNRPGMISSLWVKLTSPEAITGFRRAIRADPRLSNLWAQNQIDYYERRIGNIAQFTRYMAAGVSVLLGLGACLVIAGMLGIALHHRRQQTATLRSLGFDRWAVMLANLLDVLVIGTVSALLTAGVAAWGLNGVNFGAANFEQAIYAYFVVDFNVVATVVIYALVLGILSSVFPLRKAVQDRLVTVLQE